MTKSDFSWLSESEFRERTSITLDWISRSFAATGNKGSSAFYRKLPWRKGHWAAAYPETTGYLIETLLDYHKITGNDTLKKLALDAARWLVLLQHQNGAMPGGFADGPMQPSVFNTGMILFGLKRAYQETNDPILLASMDKASKWLLRIQGPDGEWKQAAYSEGFIPSYYTKVVWAVLEANKVLGIPSVDQKMNSALEFYRRRITDDFFICDCGFHLGEPALTHTLAYSLTGFLHSARILKNIDAYQQVVTVCKKLAATIFEKGKTAGTYRNHWEGNYHFQCMTGNAQLSIIFSNLFEWERDARFQEVAMKVFNTVIQSQRKKGPLDTIGAIPGSKPIWGKYFRFSYPNWGGKFFLDAYQKLMNI